MLDVTLYAVLFWVSPLADILRRLSRHFFYVCSVDWREHIPLYVGDLVRSFAHGCSLGENPLAFLRTQPQFLHMRQAIQQNPTRLPALLQQLGRENPQLLQVRPTGKPVSAFLCLQP